jgi:hypothetical protein
VHLEAESRRPLRLFHHVGHPALSDNDCHSGCAPCASPISHCLNIDFLDDTAKLDFSLYGGAESLAEGKPARAPRRTVLVEPTQADDGMHHPGPPQDPSDFLWLMTEEPHRSRRMAILKAHPEVRRYAFQAAILPHADARVNAGYQAHGPRASH